MKLFEKKREKLVEYSPPLERIDIWVENSLQKGKGNNKLALERREIGPQGMWASKLRRKSSGF
jgi:hypothetical protein